jgi:hypothetical protein
MLERRPPARRSRLTSATLVLLAMVAVGVGACGSGDSPKKPPASPPSIAALRYVQECVGGAMSDNGLAVEAVLDHERHQVRITYGANGLSDDEVKQAVADAPASCPKLSEATDGFVTYTRDDSVIDLPGGGL